VYGVGKADYEAMEGRRQGIAVLLCIPCVSLSSKEPTAPDIVDMDRIVILKSVHEVEDKEGICIEPLYGAVRGSTLEQANPRS
jgi:hypothetical protein